MYIAIVRMFNCMAIGGFNDYQFKTGCNRVDFEKRLSVWWKKYGDEKLNTFTYWADR